MFPIPRYTPKHRRNIKIKVYDEGQPVFKARGDSSEVKKKLADFFKYK